MSIELSITAINDDEKPCNLFTINENGNAMNKMNSFKEAYKPHKVDKNYNNSKYATRIPNDSYSTMEELLKGIFDK